MNGIETIKRERLVARMMADGIRHPAVLEAMRAVPREQWPVQ